MHRAAVLFSLAMLGAGCSSKREQPALGKAIDYLWRQQDKDGGWHSRTYGLLRSGQSLTPFVLVALLEAPEGVRAESAERAIAFIQRNANAEGALGMMDPVAPDYPNYATALAVRALVKAARMHWDRDIAPMVEYLRRQQFSEANGWKREDAPYGAWGMGGEIRRPPSAGHVDLSMTRHVLEALAAAGVPKSDVAFTRAAVFLERCQNPDGGFFFSTIEPDTNKAGEENGRFRSYGTTTADGILGLRILGRPADRAERWLREHHQPDGVPGFTGVRAQQWTHGMRFYYAAAATAAMPALAVLLPPQRPDGSWVNSNNIMKEDDPLIATAFALRALTATAAR